VDLLGEEGIQHWIASSHSLYLEHWGGGLFGCTGWLGTQHSSWSCHHQLVGGQDLPLGGVPLTAVADVWAEVVVVGPLVITVEWPVVVA